MNGVIIKDMTWQPGKDDLRPDEAEGQDFPAALILLDLDLVEVVNEDNVQIIIKPKEAVCAERVS